jgi:hypothetical protein
MMLLAMFAAVALGLSAKEFGRREMSLAAGIAVSLTLIYYLRPMSMT